MGAPEPSYTSNHEVQADGSVTFACSSDQCEWPWLALSPQHPIVIQTQNFWISVESGQAAGTRDDSKWSALTWTDWSLGDRNAGMATCGVFRRLEDGRKLSFETELFDEADRLIARIRGKGVVFRTRDFESWRNQSKAQASLTNTGPCGFRYAPRETLGLSQSESPLIAPLNELASGLKTAALITPENGLMPRHPYLSGSGDHVNSPHLAEISRQATCLVNNGEPVMILSAEMDMHRYIELGTPIDMYIERTSETGIAVAISQLQKSCATVAMEWA